MARNRKTPATVAQIPDPAHALMQRGVEDLEPTHEAACSEAIERAMAQLRTLRLEALRASNRGITGRRGRRPFDEAEETEEPL